MKKIILCLLSISMLASCGKKNKLVGEWHSQKDYDKSTLIFKEDGEVVIIKDGKVQDELTGERGVLKYEVNDSHDPAWFDLIIYDKKNKEESFRLKGLYELISENTLKICLPNRSNDIPMRPDAFTNDNSTVIFERK